MARIALINEKGGIHGRKIVYHMFDDGYNPAKTKAGVKELQEGIGMGQEGGMSGALDAMQLGLGKPCGGGGHGAAGNQAVPFTLDEQSRPRIGGRPVPEIRLRQDIQAAGQGLR